MAVNPETRTLRRMCVAPRTDFEATHFRLTGHVYETLGCLIQREREGLLTSLHLGRSPQAGCQQSVPVESDTEQAALISSIEKNVLDEHFGSFGLASEAAQSVHGDCG